MRQAEMHAELVAEPDGTGHIESRRGRKGWQGVDRQGVVRLGAEQHRRATNEGGDRAGGNREEGGACAIQQTGWLLGRLPGAHTLLPRTGFLPDGGG